MHILIVEDEDVVARRLARMLDSILGDRIDDMSRAETLDEARIRVEQTAIDLLFLDLNLHGRDGYSVLEETASRSFQTIIVSAHADQAIRAFELGVTDFVAKPYTEDRLRIALERVFERENELRDRLKYLAVRRSGVVETVAVEDLLFIQGAGDYSELHLRSGETRLHDKSLTTLENLLPSRFVRVHRSWIIGLDEIRELRSHPGSRYEIATKSGVMIPVSRSRIETLRTMLRMRDG